MSRTITAMFDDRTHANAAVEQLIQTLNVRQDAIQVHAAENATVGTSSANEDTGFWASLKDLFVPDEDRTAYAEGVRRGAVVVSAQIDDAMLDRAMDILENNGAVDLDSREAEWRQSGWTGSTMEDSNTVVASSASSTGMGVVATDAGTGSSAYGATPPVASATMPAAARLGGEDVIPIVEESLRVGKRDVERGRVKVRSYVVETAVTEQVTLREEIVDVQRRVVDRAVTDADDIFRDRTIEVVETSEEAVVAKDVRITGEVVIRKDATERTETVQDTVRRTEVEIDDTTGVRGVVADGSLAGTTATTNPPGTVASRAVDKALDTNISGANPTSKP